MAEIEKLNLKNLKKSLIEYYNNNYYDYDIRYYIKIEIDRFIKSLEKARYKSTDEEMLFNKFIKEYKEKINFKINKKYDDNDLDENDSDFLI